MSVRLLLFVAISMLISCTTTTMDFNSALFIPKLIASSNFEKAIGGKDVSLYTLSNIHGTTTQITNYGARIVNIFTQDRKGDFADIVLGYDSLANYLRSNGPCYGAIVGRYANRIGNVSFSLNGQEFPLEANHPPNHFPSTLLNPGEEYYSMSVYEFR